MSEKLIWTKARPIESGFYFYKRRTIQVVKIVPRANVLYCLSIGQPVSDLKGEWAGPIQEPIEPEESQDA